MQRVRFAVPVLTLVASLCLAAEKAEIGKPAPSFELKDLDGKVVKSEDLKDKVVVLEWFNAGCPAVQFHTPHIKKVVEQYAEKEVVWLAIDSTHFATPDLDKQYQEKHELKQRILLDSDGTVGKAYGARTTPHMFVINKGTLVYAGAFDNGGFREHGDKNYVAEALDAVLAGKDVAVSTSKPYGCSVKYKD